MPSQVPARVRGAWLVRAPMIPPGAITGTAYLADEIHWTMTGAASATFDWRGAGLPSGTEYHYSIEGEAEHGFRTLPGPSQNFVAYVEGDIGDAVPYPPVGAVQSEIGRDEPWFVLMVGDLT